MRFLFRPPAAEATGLLSLPWERAAGRVGPGAAAGGPAARHLPARRAVRRHRRAGLRAQGDQRAPRPSRVPAPRRVRGGGAADGLGARHLRGPARRPGGHPGHPVPRVLDVLPVAVLAAAGCALRRPAARHHGRAAGPAAPGRRLLGRLLPVQHPLPARRRGADRLPGGRRDRGPPPRRSRRGSAPTTSTSPGSAWVPSCWTCSSAGCCPTASTRSRWPRACCRGTRRCGTR